VEASRGLKESRGSFRAGGMPDPVLQAAHHTKLFSKGVNHMEKQTATTTTAAMTAKDRREPLNLRKRIGSTTYVVNVHFSSNAKETLEDKILRLIGSEVRKTA
jgi:hypothetical protein